MGSTHAYFSEWLDENAVFALYPPNGSAKGRRVDGGRSRLLNAAVWVSFQARLGCLLPVQPVGDLLAGAHLQFLEDVPDVGGDGAFGDDELLGDAAVGETLCYEEGDLLLAAGEAGAGGLPVRRSRSRSPTAWS